MTPIDYNNPNDYWHGHDPYKGMTDDERMKAGCLQGAAFIVAFIVVLLLCALLGSCTTTKYVPVTETRTEHHWHTDSVRERDSTHTERETVIREVANCGEALGEGFGGGGGVNRSWGHDGTWQCEARPSGLPAISPTRGEIGSCGLTA